MKKNQSGKCKRTRFSFLSLMIILFSINFVLASGGGGYSDTTAPTCTVDYLLHKSTGDVFNLDSGMTYTDSSGIFFTYGTANDSESFVENVQYNRTSPNLYYLFTDADPVDGTFDEFFESWRNPSPIDSFVDGEHQICCRAADSAGNVGNGDVCKDFCVDTDSPSQVMNVVHQNPSSCLSNYVNIDPEFSWDSSSDNGCSGVDYYEVNVFDSEAGLHSTGNTSSNSWTVNLPTNGAGYYIKVRAIDNSGNVGDWSSNSETVYYDTEDPVVEITGPDQNTWYDSDFVLTETDSDNLGVYGCEYKIRNDGIDTLDWTSVVCNENITIDVSMYCPVDGLNDCKVYKRVTDNACNQDSTHKQFDVDTSAPLTTKSIGDPKYRGFAWLSWLIDWFVTDVTQFSLNCTDLGVGCGDTSYRLKYNSGNWSEWNSYSGAFNLDSGDGVYEVEYYSLDLLNHSEDVKSEIDYVDTVPPVTEKSIGDPKYFDGTNYWVNSETVFSLNCTDDAVGCNSVHYKIDGVESSGVSPLSFNLSGLAEGLHNIEYWSSDNLGNEEIHNMQVDYLDDTSPEFNIVNNFGEGLEVMCQQSVVVSATDSGSGVAGGLVEWYNETGDLVKTQEMVHHSLTDALEATFFELYGLMEGNYSVRISVHDNVGNVKTQDVNVNLPNGVICASIQEQCVISDPSIGGDCTAKFHVGIRGGNSVKMDLQDLFGVAPQNLSARITNTSEDLNAVGVGNVNFAGVPQFNGGTLQISDELYTSGNFWLHLSIPPNLDEEYPLGDTTNFYLKAFSV